MTPIRSDDQLTALVKGKGSETFGKIVDRLKESPLFNVRGAGQLTVAMVTSQFKKIRDYAVEQRRSAEKFDACGDDFTEGYLFTGSRLFGLSLKIPPYQPARVGCIPSAPGRSFSHGLVASLHSLGFPRFIGSEGWNSLGRCQILL